MLTFMNTETFKTLIKEGQNVLQSLEVFPREFEFEKEGRYVLVGIRQAGKSYLLYQRVKMLLSDGHSIQEIV